MEDNIDVIKKNKIALLSVLLFLNTYFFQHYDNIPNPNEQSRIYLATAIVDNQKISIDEQIERFGNTIDISRHNNKAYCDKAPGLSFLAVPFYAALKFFSKLFGYTLTYPIILKFLRTVLLSVPSTIFSLLILSTLIRYTRDFQLSLILTAFYSIGTIAFTYSNLLFGHQLGAMLVFFLFYLINRNKEEQTIKLFFGGIIAALSVMVEYPLILIASVLSIYQLVILKRKIKFTAFIIGGFLCISILFLYNHYAFGSIFSTGYSHIANPTFAQFHKEGLLGVTTPKLNALIGSFFSSMRGIFYFMPVLFFSLAGIYFMLKDPALRRDGILILIILLLMSNFISSFSYWQAGGTISQRHLTALIPFLIIPLGVVLQKIIEKELYPILVLLSVLMLFSMLLIPYATILFPFFSVVYPNPLFELPINLLRWGSIPPNVGNIFHLKGFSSIVPFLIVWFLFISYIIFHTLSLYRTRFSAFLSSIIVVCMTFLLITAASFIAQEKNYENKMKDVIGIMENFRPGRNSCEYVIENNSKRFNKTTCYAFLKRGTDSIREIREAR